jgi:hypothetical protein
VLSPLLETANPFIHSTVMMRRDAMDRVGGYRDAFSAAEDYDLWLRLAEVGRVRNLPRKLAHYRMWPGSTTSTQSRKMQLIADIARRSAQFRRQAGEDPAEDLAGDADFLGDGWQESPFWPEIFRYRLRVRFRTAMTAGDWEIACRELAGSRALLRPEDRRFLSRILTERLLSPGLPLLDRLDSAAQLVRSGRRKAFTALYRHLAGRTRHAVVD